MNGVRFREAGLNQTTQINLQRSDIIGPNTGISLINPCIARPLPLAGAGETML